MFSGVLGIWLNIKVTVFMLLVGQSAGLASRLDWSCSVSPVRSNIIQLLDKYSSRGSTGSLQGQLQTRSRNAKHLPQPLPVSSGLYHRLLPASLLQSITVSNCLFPPLMPLFPQVS